MDKKQIGIEIGASGTVIQNGIISHEEYNKELAGNVGLKVYDRMRKSDSTVRASLQVVKLPIEAAERFIQPASDDQKDIDIADYVEHNLFNVLNFDAFMREVLTLLEFGFSSFEKVLEPIEFNSKTFIGYTKLATRKQTSIYRWQQSDGQPGVQQFTIAKGSVDIPAEKLVIFTNEREGDNYAGVSLLRSAYKHWYMKDTLYKIDAMAHERQGLGIMQIKRPAQAGDKEKQAARVAARQARANEEAYVETPEGWEMDFMDMKAGSLRDPVSSIAHHDRQIMKNVLGQFLEIGAQKSSGSYSASNDHSRLFELSLEAVAKNIRATINDAIIKPLVDLNFTVTDYPTIAFGKIGDENVPQFADAVQKLTAAGVLTQTVDVEKSARQVMHLADMPEEVEEMYEAKMTSLVDLAKNPPTPPDPADPSAKADPNKEEVDKEGDSVNANDLVRTATAFHDFLVDKSDQYVDA